MAHRYWCDDPAGLCNCSPTEEKIMSEEDVDDTPYVPKPTYTEGKRKFEWQEIGVQAIWTDTLANPIEMSMMRDVAIRGVRVMFNSYVAAGGPVIGHMETPATWWDHWKVEHPRISKYLRSPTFRYEEHEFFARVCPHLPRPFRESEHTAWVSDRVPDATTNTDD